ncbi:T6SS effector amidase Tae4 family protein [Tateyamaria sp. SN6-1]|uniref:T6SS effector amidase Tae4 family protein n=1 Tax=Tateyamaria sp. SN6-1 TaxID=3092148 RepID=UPI0039F50DC9
MTKPVVGLPDVQKATGDNFEDKFNNKQGIIFFKDYWQEKGQSFAQRSGDHIDLWRNGRMPSAPDWRRELAELVGLVTHLEYSKEVWLWELP